MSKKSKDNGSNDLFEYALHDLNKEYGNIAYVLGEESPADLKTFIDTGSTPLNMIVSNRHDGGWPVGRIIEISGLPGSGKSLVSDLAILNTQKMGGLGIIVDTENARSPDYLRVLGVDMEKLLYFQIDTIEEIFEVLEKMINKIQIVSPKKLITIVVDSIAAASTKEEMAKDFGQPTIALKARLISQAMRKLGPVIGKLNVCLIFTNQLRENIGVMFGDKFTTPGGKAIPFHSSVRIRLTPSGKIEEDKDVIAVGVNAKCVKNRIAPPFRKAHFTIYFNKGISDVEDWPDILVEKNVMSKRRGGRSGNIYSFSVDGEMIEIPSKEWSKTLMADSELYRKVKHMTEEVMILNLTDVTEEIEETV